MNLKPHRQEWLCHLFVSQGNHGIDARDAAGRNVAGNQRKNRADGHELDNWRAANRGMAWRKNINSTSAAGLHLIDLNC
jgi:hypothetical protein